jgi:hypothetical protein
MVIERAGVHSCREAARGDPSAAAERFQARTSDCQFLQRGVLGLLALALVQ